MKKIAHAGVTCGKSISCSLPGQGWKAQWTHQHYEVTPSLYPTDQGTKKKNPMTLGLNLKLSDPLWKLCPTFLNRVSPQPRMLKRSAAWGRFLEPTDVFPGQSRLEADPSSHWPASPVWWPETRSSVFTPRRHFYLLTWMLSNREIKWKISGWTDLPNKQNNRSKMHLN